MPKPSPDDRIIAPIALERETRIRLDEMLAVRGLVPSRSRARDLVRRGLVTVDGQVATRPAAMVGEASRLAVATEAATWVSRGADKLIASLARFGLDSEGRTALDIGASTGGFTEVLLRRGATRVYAVDVGTGQLHPRLAGDPRVISLEQTDARDLDRSHVPEPVGAIVADVSFISLRKVLPAAMALAAPDAWLVALVKPQFEAGPEHVSKSGIVRDADVRARVTADVASWLGAVDGWCVIGTLASPLRGGSGNAEFLIAAVRDG
jgi:23S rRNA (cytidine1920-2'-O)/16S rRNA (cytidine1409-2'-O)-methyltransferase